MRVHRRSLAIAAVGALGLLALQGYPQWLQYDRQQLLSGELWRVWTAHIVHTNLAHFALNTAAALLIYRFFFRAISLRALWVSALLFSALISAGLFLFLPALDWYNGLSGLLHAMVAYFSIRLAAAGAGVYWLWLCALWLKVAIEWLGHSPVYASLGGDMNVITEAHLAGAVTGTVAGLVVWFFRQRKPGEMANAAARCSCEKERKGSGFKGSGPLL